jgi:hypothetical protein
MTASLTPTPRSGELQQLRKQSAAARTRLDELPDRDHRCDPN